MNHEEEQKILEHEIEKLNEELKDLGYKLSELLNVDCNFGACSFDKEMDNVREKMAEVEKTKKLLEFLKNNIDKCHEDQNP
ncbi:MAG: hypothetical protein ACMUHX_03055 [bacterium]